MATKAPPAPSRYIGTFRCTSDQLLYRVSHPTRAHDSLQMQRRREDEPEWRAAYAVEEAQIQRLLDFHSFIPL